MFRLHMAGLDNATSDMFGYKDNKLVVNYQDKIIGISTNDNFSVIDLGNHRSWVFINTPLFQTCMLLNHGCGRRACYTHEIPAFDVNYKYKLTHQAVKLDESCLTVSTLFEVVDSLLLALNDMYNDCMGWDYQMACEKSEYETIYENLLMEVNSILVSEKGE
jgi:hypothetical protein